MSIIVISQASGTVLTSSHKGWGTKQLVNKVYERRLTVGEIALLTPYYQTRVDYSKIRVRKQNYLPNDRIVTPNGHIYFPKDYYRDDYSTLPNTDQLKWTFIHEVCHAWQYQHGYLVKTKGITIGAKGGYTNSVAYKYNYYDYSKLFSAYNMEQQASMIEHYAMIKGGKWTFKDHAIRERYLTEVVMQFLDLSKTDQSLLPTTTDFADMESHIKRQQIQPPVVIDPWNMMR